MSVVFLTGATGFVGGAVASSLLADSRVEELHLLVRAQDAAHARHRVVTSLARFGTGQADTRRVNLICGSLADFPLANGMRQRLTHVIHAAAHTSFRSSRMAWSSNVEG